MDPTAISGVWRDAARTIVQATCTFRPEAIEEALSRSFMLGEPAEIFDNVIAPAMRRIGELWEARRISVAQEHLVSGLVEDVLVSMHAAMQPRVREPKILLLCLQDESHTIAIKGVGLHFAAWGVRSVILGARTPPSAVADAVAALQPALVGISATMSPSRPISRQLLLAYGEACGSVPWILGGAAALNLASWVEEAGGRVVAGAFVDEQRTVRRILTEALRQRPGDAYRQ